MIKPPKICPKCGQPMYGYEHLQASPKPSGIGYGREHVICPPKPEPKPKPAPPPVEVSPPEEKPKRWRNRQKDAPPS